MKIYLILWLNGHLNDYWLLRTHSALSLQSTCSLDWLNWTKMKSLILLALFAQMAGAFQTSVQLSGIRQRIMYTSHQNILRIPENARKGKMHRRPKTCSPIFCQAQGLPAQTVSAVHYTWFLAILPALALGFNPLYDAAQASSVPEDKRTLIILLLILKRVYIYLLAITTVDIAARRSVEAAEGLGEGSMLYLILFRTCMWKDAIDCLQQLSQCLECIVYVQTMTRFIFHDSCPQSSRPLITLLERDSNSSCEQVPGCKFSMRRFWTESCRKKPNKRSRSVQAFLLTRVDEDTSSNHDSTHGGDSRTSRRSS